MLTNSLTLITPTLDPLGIILDPTIGHINHSCDPNAYIMMDGPGVSIRTLRPVKKDEEIYISYIDTTNPFHRRQSELQARWFFSCKCTKCQKGATLDEDRWCIEPKYLSDKTRLVADALVKQEQFSEDSANYVGESGDEKRVAVIQGRAFAAYEEEQRIADPQGAIEVIQGAMQFCHETGLWPMYRQPLAALRDDLIVGLLSVRSYRVAFTQCAMRYKHILPKLYPVHFHPIRVVQTWQMAMLAAYLANTEDIKEPNINMGLIAMMLVRQVLDASNLSHGANSAFTKSVRQKAEEMIEELKRRVGDPDKEVMNRELELQKDMLMRMGDSVKI